MNQQLIDYIKEQLASGADRANIKNTLISAGWQESDVEEAFVAVAGQSSAGAGQKESASQEPATVSTGNPSESSPELTKPASTEPASPATEFTSGSASTVSDPASSMPATETQSASYSSELSEEEGSDRKFPVSTVIFSAVIVLLIAGGILFYVFPYRGALRNVTILETENAQLRSEISSLTSSNSDMQASLADLTEEKEMLERELMFVATSEGAPETPITVEVRGSIGRVGTAGAFFLTTAHGVRVDVINSSELGVSEALSELVGDEVMLTGSHVPGSNDLTVSAINGVDVADATDITEESQDDEASGDETPTTE